MRAKETVGRVLQHPVTIAVVLSAVVHLALTPLLVTALVDRGVDAYTPVFFTKLARGAEVTAREEPPEEDAYEPPDRVPEGQVVDAPFPGREEDRRPDPKKKTSFVSDKTVRVKRQMKSGASLAGEYDVGAETAGPGELNAADELPGLLQPEMTEGARLPESTRGEAPPGAGPVTLEAAAAGPGIQLLPTFKAVAGAVKGSGLDKLDGVDEGEKTLLDTDEWKHAGFFLRVKSLVAQRWRPGEAYLLYDPTGNVYGYKDRETIVKVVLACDGKIKHLYVKHPSGAKFLDDEALDALREAAPFANPPAPLCDPERKIVVFNFGFFVKVGDKPVLKVKKYDF